MAKTTSKRKQTRNFLQSGQLKNQIEARHKRRAFEQKKKGRDAKRNKGVLPAHQQPEEDDDVKEEKAFDEIKRKKQEQQEDEDEDEELDVDDVLGAAGLAGSDAGESGDEDGEDADDLEDDDLSGLSDDDDVAGANPMVDMQALAEKDPAFYKFLQENDPDLLKFNADAAGDVDMSDESEEDEEEEAGSKKKSKKAKKAKDVKGKGKENILTKETRSLRAFRKLLIAFRSAASSGADPETVTEERERIEIHDPKLFRKVILTTLKYTPLVLGSFVPYKEANGKFKLSTNSKQYAIAQRLLKSYFVSLHSLLASVSSQSDIPSYAVTESANLVPWIVGNRKIARGWVKMLLGVYDSASDEGTYATLLGSSRQTSAYTLPAIELMKFSASELFLLQGKQEQDLAYQLAFSYIRSLAILLRKGVKDASKEAYKNVYNWQFVHAIDFWSIVLATAGDKQRVAEQGESPLQHLVYPLVQVVLGAIRLVPTSRYYPLRFRLVRSLLRLVQRTGTFIPLAASLFEILDSPELTRRSKPSTLKPLDWDYYLKCPVAYQRTRVYADALVDELVYLLTEYYGALATSIAFPELVLPATVALKRHAKKATSGKVSTQMKQLVERLEANARWIEQKREGVEFGPNKRDKVDRFLANEEIDKTPMGTHIKLQRKLREAKKATMERALHQAEDL
ncbi:Nucleolar Complex 2 protein [Rhodotorula mucilaginosa]|uniref:Nucleolar Complex 2 protein n=1 Tax=Rhodotorula mucilaginosa TaxID=5537 RepID=A0A9P7B565_RHOMI|nr:Nucleolar Complex 2 protein [Rhodotorula mucilaginosa]